MRHAEILNEQLKMIDNIIRGVAVSCCSLEDALPHIILHKIKTDLDEAQHIFEEYQKKHFKT